ncbi:MAG: MFS transporter [Chloroflexi bacterium]|nr:MFS transporter [Chloroflexota bacterium]
MDTITTESVTIAPAAERPVPLWRNRDFNLLWSGQIVSTLGTQVSLVAFPLLLLAVTGSPAWAGLLGALRGLPFVLLALPAGALVDRWDRRRLMVVCDIGRALALGSVPLALALGHVNLLHLALVTLIEGALFTLFNIAEVSSLPRVVPKQQLPAAVARTQASAASIEMIGPAAGGALYGLGVALPFLIDAVSFLASAVALRAIRAPLQGATSDATVRLGALWAEIRQGVGWLWRQPALRALALLTSGLNLFSFGYTLVIIVLAQGMGATPAQIGLLFASGGAGGIVGALLAAPLQRRFPAGRILVVAAWAWALTWPLYALAPDLLTLGLANAVGFIVVPIYFGTQYSYRLSLIPDALQGRVNSVFRLLSYGVQPAGLALAGALLAAVGPVATVWIVTAPQVALALVATLYRPLRRAGARAA